ncbi:unnamed protein product [Prorocentrum cordatum]|uniref:Uncharacterized protein n=1 Tax=Prorocentrum cordatum TaxID=2364126 RepID=A0ABN9W1P4_9DINO|nr:unnamed protein product [Polarella glacialis]
MLAAGLSAPCWPSSLSAARHAFALTRIEDHRGARIRLWSGRSRASSGAVAARSGWCQSGARELGGLRPGARLVGPSRRSSASPAACRGVLVGLPAARSSAAAAWCARPREEKISSAPLKDEGTDSTSPVSSLQELSVTGNGAGCQWAARW